MSPITEKRGRLESIFSTYQTMSLEVNGIALYLNNTHAL